jgi:uncharacterized protein YqgQ
MTIRFRHTKDHDEFILGQKQLTTMYGQKLLTREQLSEATTAMYDDGDYIDRSIGFEWIKDHPAWFAETAARCDFKCSDFLREHGHIFWVGNRILLNPELLALVAEDEREEFVKEIYLKHGSFNSNYWTQVVMEAGIPKSTVTDLILEKLASVPDDCETKNYETPLHALLRYRRESNDEISQWTLLTDEQLDTAMQLAARKTPTEFFLHRTGIEARLGEARFAELADEVIAKLTRLTPAQQKYAEEQYFRNQLEIARQLTGNADFILRLIVKLDYATCILLKIDPATARNLFREKSELFADNIANLYRQTWTDRHKEGKPVAPWLESELERILYRKGYIVGTVEEYIHTPKGGQPRRQLQVRHERKIYTQERRQYDYTPKPGDQVLIATYRGYELTPKVTATEFYPIDRILTNR